MRFFKTTVLAILACTFTQFSTADACTNFCFETPDGPVFGCNLDLFIPGDGLVFINRRGISKTGFDPGTTGKKAEWISKYGSVTFNLAGREMVFGGMNEAGLVLSTMELITSEFPHQDARPPLTIGMWAQYILDNCSSIEEAIEAEKQVRIEDSAPPQHYFIADINGNCVAIEWEKGEVVIHSGTTLPVKAMANSFYAKSLAVYQKGGPHWWQSDRGQSNKRFAKAAARNKQFKTSGEPNVIKYAFDTLTKVVGAAHTKWSIVYDIQKRKIYYGSAASPALKFLSFDAFDFSCTAPLLMLDINAPIEGNVETFFKPYDHDMNLTLFRTLCHRYELELSEEEVEKFTNHIESFECAQ